VNDQASQLRGLVDAARARDGGPASIVPESVPSGMVSYAPPASRRSDRGVIEAKIIPPRSTLVSAAAAAIAQPASPASPVRLARAIAVTSGKGGVGKSNLAVNLAVLLAHRDLKVCLLDADLGMANADVLCNLQPRLTLEHVVGGRCRLADAMLLAPGGFRLIPGASGVARIADLRSAQRGELLAQLSALERIADVILIDCGAGISANVVGFAASAHTVVVATTPEPTAITDGYGMIKSLLRQSPDAVIQVVVNMAASETEAQGVFNRINRVTQTFLNRPLQYGGAVPIDPAVPAAVRQRLPFTLLAPDAPSTLALKRLAARLVPGGEERLEESAIDAPVRTGFFSRLASWLGISDQAGVD